MHQTWALSTRHFAFQYHCSIFLRRIACLVADPRLGTSNVPFDDFALFLGISMSVTAFPVLARILIERGIQKTELGIMALTCAVQMM